MSLVRRFLLPADVVVDSGNTIDVLVRITARQTKEV